MVEYLEKQAVIEAFNEAFANNTLLSHTLIAVSEEIIDKVEVSDVQPVVRCKDCKYRIERHYEDIGEKIYIKYECKFTKYSMSDEGFCSFGAKKTMTELGTGLRYVCKS